jgi:hypothetical protein
LVEKSVEIILPMVRLLRGCALALAVDARWSEPSIEFEARSDSDGIVERREVNLGGMYGPSFIEGVFFELVEDGELLETSAHEPLAEGRRTMGYWTLTPVWTANRTAAATRAWSDGDEGSEVDRGRSTLDEYDEASDSLDS